MPALLNRLIKQDVRVKHAAIGPRVTIDLLVHSLLLLDALIQVIHRRIKLSLLLPRLSGQLSSFHPFLEVIPEELAAGLFDLVEVLLVAGLGDQSHVVLPCAPIDPVVLPALLHQLLELALRLFVVFLVLQLGQLLQDPWVVVQQQQLLGLLDDLLRLILAPLHLLFLAEEVVVGFEGLVDGRVALEHHEGAFGLAELVYLLVHGLLLLLKLRIDSIPI